MSEAAPPPVDGRTARLERNRDAVLDAVLELFAEGVFQPSAAEAAERSGLSLRSVYRYFDDLDSLMRAAIARNLERNLPHYQIPDLGQGPLDERVDRLVRARIDLHDRVGAIARAAVLRSRSNELIAAQLEHRFSLLREQTAAMFAPEIEAAPEDQRYDITATLDLLTGFEAMEVLRESRHLSDEETHHILSFALRAVLRGVAADPEGPADPTDQAQPPA